MTTRQTRRARRDNGTARIAGAELGLWEAVLLSSLDDLRYGKPWEQKDAQAWFSACGHEVGDFLWIADLFGLDPSAIRRRLTQPAPSPVDCKRKVESKNADSSDNLNYPPTMIQIFGVVLDRAESIDGVVFCPQRRSEIAMMRCGEFQERFGCGRGCANAATREQIEELKRILPEENDPVVYCRDCGKPKRTPVGQRCSRCANRLSVFPATARRCNRVPSRKRGERLNIGRPRSVQRVANPSDNFPVFDL